MKIAILGANGMLGTELTMLCRNTGIKVSCHDLPELDITKKSGGFNKIPVCDRVVNCAAYTNVDGAESNKDTAFSINSKGVTNIAEWCTDHNTPLLHISSDYIFDGKSNTPYSEDSSPNPINVYGESKLAGERAVIAGCKKYLIIRTQSLFGKYGNNFVQTIVSLIRKRKEPLNVVNDQISCPTYTLHLAKGILDLIKSEKQGIVNVSAMGECSWYDLARSIAEKINQNIDINPVTSLDYIRPARRPAYAVLDKKLFHTWTDNKMPTWKAGLNCYLKGII